MAGAEGPTRLAGGAVVLAIVTAFGCGSSAPATGNETGGGGKGGSSGAAGGSANGGGAGGGSHGSGGVIGPGGASGGSGDGGGAAGGSSGSGGVPAGGAAGTGHGGTSGGAGGGDCPSLGTMIDLSATTVSGTITVNGARVTDVSQGSGAISLVGAGGDRAQLGTSWLAAGSYSVLVMPGTYDLVYDQDLPGPALPVNSGATLRNGIVVGASPLALDVDIPATNVSITSTINHAPFGGGARDFHKGGFALVNATGDSAHLTDRGTSAAVLPGTYDLVFNGSGLGSDMPTNSAALIQSGIVVGAAPVSLNVDVTATKVWLTLTINGVAIPAPNGTTIDASLRSASGDVVQLLFDASSNLLTAWVIPGTYDLYYTFSNIDGVSNQSAKIRTGLVVADTTVTTTVDVTATPVSIAATINGAAPTGANGQFELFLRGAAGETFGLPNDGSSTMEGSLDRPRTRTSPSRAGS